MTDVMLDLETLGKSSGCIILSIGAVMFDPYSNHYGEKFYANILQESCRNYGLFEDASTVAWWSMQDEKSKQVLLPDQKPLDIAIYQFVEWFTRNGGERIWSQGASFDIPIIEAAFRAVKIVPPWQYWNVRDTRTLYDFCGFDPSIIKREGVYHYAPDDCTHQIRCVQTALQSRASKMIEQ